MQLEDWLDDLCVRFIVNIPAEELASIERICFQIEEAQWFYEDFIRPLDPSLPSLSLKPFFQRITQRCPLFKDWPEEDMGNAFERFLKYKNRVPVRGAILLNEKMDEVLLVKGWKKNGTWSFPRGKINKDEDDLACAIREAWEETGFDIKAAGLSTDPKKVKHIERTIRGQNMKLFVFRDIPYDANFEPQTRKEISKIQWFRLVDLPTEKRRNQAEGTGQHLVLNANKFYVVAPFIHDLKKLIHAERKKDNRSSSKLAAAPMAADPVLAAEQEFATTTGHLALPISPPVPSSLPEVTTASVQDPLLNLKQQLNIPPSSQSSSMDTKAKSNDLLSLLRKGSAAEMRNDPHTPMEQTTFPDQPRSPKRPPPVSHLHDMMNMQSPPPSVDLHPQAQPTAPPSSALPQLNQHTRSLLDAFSKPKVPESPAMEARRQLPASKQNLLAAFVSQPKPARQPTSTPATNAGNDLLQMIQRKQDATAASMPLNAACADPSAEALHQTPSIFDLPTQLVQQTDQPATQGPAESSSRAQLQTTSVFAPGPQATQQADQPAARGLANSSSHVEQQAAPVTVPSAQQPRSWASIATGAKQPPQPKKTEPVTTAQPGPAELSATSEHVTKPLPAQNAKANLLSLLGSMPPKSPKPVETKSRSGTTSANLDRPIDQPAFDTLARTSPLLEEIKREPVSTERKLFDPKQGEPKQSPAAIRVMSRHDDRNRTPKSPRTIRQKQSNTSRPVTPKESQKPFQPQILKRPQTSESDAPIGLPSLLTETSATQKQVSTPSIMSPPTAAGNGLISPRTNAPQAVTTNEITNYFSSAKKSPIPQDPSRAALLDLLRTPTQQATKPEVDVTPRQACSTSFTSMQQAPIDGVMSPPSVTQLVSPVLDNEHDIYAPRSRVSSLASTAASNVGGRAQIEKRQTAAGDKAFLMSYLKNFAGQGQEAA
ncbi:mRNA-decapping enzyme subunit 2 [Knufia obscura]|uniref:mRNA-decapping enzyme subunit 2 n=1 Tax=Knufia obscura TaxID=1635080 RepID=A0ABR0RFC4_9EURO|nr:mRNA-decapping enzyme subunit 2 [Knufia obscura]